MLDTYYKTVQLAVTKKILQIHVIVDHIKSENIIRIYSVYFPRIYPVFRAYSDPICSILPHCSPIRLANSKQFPAMKITYKQDN
jgi:hypothetical protein